MLFTDANTTSNSLSSGTSHSFSHTCGGRPNRALFVIAIMKTVGVPPAPTGVTATYAGVSMTSMGEITSSSNKVTLAAFYLAKPATGSNTVSISWTNTADCIAVARSYAGVHQGTPVLPGSYNSQQFTGGSPSMNVASVPGDIVIDGIGYATTSTSTATPGAGQSSILDIELGASNFHGSASWEGGGVSVTMSWSLTNMSVGAQLGFSVHPAAESGGLAVSPSMIF